MRISKVIIKDFVDIHLKIYSYNDPMRHEGRGVCTADEG